MAQEVVKHAGGRPPIFIDPLIYGAKCDEYFDWCTTQKKRPTITGLALFLGFADKSTLYEYRDKPEFSYPTKRSILRIEEEYEQGLTENSVAGRIFALKNMGWKDKVETGFTDNDGKDVSPVQIYLPGK